MNLENFQKIGAKLKELGLETTAVTVCTPDENPISPDAAKRQAGAEPSAGVERLWDVPEIGRTKTNTERWRSKC